MALIDPPDTLAYHRARVLTVHRDMGAVPCKAVSKQIELYQENDTASNTSPDSEALWFYGMNHGMALISARYAQLEPLRGPDREFVEAYYAAMGEKSVRAFYYLVLICTREARHCKSLDKDAGNILKHFGAEVLAFYQGINEGEAGIHKKLLSKPPNTPIGNYVKSLQWVFYNGKWSGGFGGKAWGAVADCLVRFVTGEYTAEMMLDTNWTLAHNNGPIFNKGIFYGGYSQTLYRILDVQRSGQIPEAILSDHQISSISPGELLARMVWLKERYPDAIGDYVNWYSVEALGALKSYAADKAKQIKKHGSEGVHVVPKPSVMKPAVQVPMFQVMPGLSVAILKKDRKKGTTG